MIKTDLTHSKIAGEDFNALYTRIDEIHKVIHTDDGVTENKWVELPATIPNDEIAKIKSLAAKIRSSYDVLVVVGVGGSYIGSYAGIKMLGSDFPVEFLGLSFDPVPVLKFLEKYKGKRIAANVISKSGTTMEITAVFNILQPVVDYLVITTDARKGNMREYADKHNIDSLIVPDRVGGRYSALSAVGLLPLAVAGIDIVKVLDGAQRAYKDTLDGQSYAPKYAAARYLIHTKQKKDVEILATFNEGLSALGDWWQQLFGESEGKHGKGLFVDSMVFSRDLHSMGQYIQQGRQLLFETIINETNPSVNLEFKPNNEKALGVPAKTMNELNKACFDGTVKAHSQADVPIVILHLDRMDESAFGYMTYFFQISCVYSAYLLGVNPYGQPGVESYKTHMKEFLG